jgi:MerT mercuric transport protein
MAHDGPTPTPVIAAAASGTTAITAAGAAACCLGPATAPLIVAAFGASGAAWLAGLKPYVPYLLAGALAALLYAFRSIRGERRACATQPVSRLRLIVARLSLLLLWISAALWLGAAVAELLFVLRG